MRANGVRPGDRIAVMLPKSPEILIALVAIWRAGAVEVPLFTAFGPEAADYRTRHSGAKLVITDPANRLKFIAAASQGVLVMTVADSVAEGDLDFHAAARGGEPFVGVTRGGDDMMVLLYTSGTTGQPKGVEFPIRGLASVHSYMTHGLDVRTEDVFWNIADPGWAYGLWYGLIGSLLLGRRMILRGRPFEAEAVFELVARHEVTNLAGAPTAFRAMRAAGVPASFRESSKLRVISSAGEPLNPELLSWSERDLGVAIHDHYGQSETGMTVGFPHDQRIYREPVPGATGCPLPGFEVDVLDADGSACGPKDEGEIAIDIPKSPLYWFRDYYLDPERTTERFRHGERYYLTSDAACTDTAGLFHFASRADDVITSAGYRIGPFEVESALIAHDAVVEVAVIGTPDDLRGEAVTAFVVTTPGTRGGDQLAEELGLFVKSRLAKHLYPRHVVFVDRLPRTPSGKIRRTVIREEWDRDHSPV
jgi:acetyl-CoA synthetase